jgi:hypothetical protein
MQNGADGQSLELPCKPDNSLPGDDHKLTGKSRKYDQTDIINNKYVLWRI